MAAASQATFVTGEEQQVLAVEEIEGPLGVMDVDKLNAVRGVETATGNKFPTLVKRFESGFGHGQFNALDSVKLVLEVMDFMLVPIRAHLMVSSMTEQAKPVYIMVGITGAGKSLAGNWILGKTITKKQVSIPAADPDDRPGSKTTVEVEGGALQLGHDQFKSMTFAPNLVNHEDFILIDFPGICDTNGFEVRLGMDLAFRELINLLKPAHVVCLVPIGSFSIGKGTAATDQLDKVRKLLPLPGCGLGSDQVASEHDGCSWMIGITKCDRDFVMDPAGEYEAAGQFISTWSHHFPSSQVVNINKLMFSPRGGVARDEFLHRLRLTRTPVEPMACLAPQLRIAYGAASVPGCLASDCLSVSDTSKLAKMLRAEQFEKLYFSSDAQKFTADPSKRAKLKESWADAKAALVAELGKMKDVSKRIRSESKRLRATKRLALEDKDPNIARLCAQGQPGLKLGFVKSEEAIMMRNAVAVHALFKELKTLTEDLHRDKCLKAGDYAEVQTKSKEVKASLDGAVQELGWKDSDDLAFNKTMWAGSIVGVAGGGALIVTVVGAAEGSIVGTVAMSGAVIGGLAAGGVAIALGLIALGVGVGLTMRNNAWSAEFKDLVIQCFDELLSTSKALLDHKKCLTAVEQALTSLQVL